MTATAPVPDVGVDPRVPRWTRWSLWMLLVSLGALLVAGVLGYWLLSVLGLEEGDLLLMAGGVAGWAAQLLVFGIMALPTVTGTTFAVRALRHGAGSLAWLGLAGNVALLAPAVLSLLASVWTTYLSA